jgi:hypothetical protein
VSTPVIGGDRFFARHDRRWFLKMAGGSVALAHWLRNGVAQAAGAGPPKRLMVLHRPNGTIREDWLRNGQRGPILEPFAPVWSHAVALKGMDIKYGANGDGDPHGAVLVTVMTASNMSSQIPPGSDDGRWNTKESLDQTWSRQSPMLNAAPIKSVQVGANGEMEGLQEPQNRTMSYSGAEQPLYPVVSPYDVYQRLFGSTMVPDNTALLKLRSRRESVLAFVKGDLGRVRKQFPASTRPSLDAHEEAIVELEASLGAPPPPIQCVKPTVPGGLPVGDLNADKVLQVANAHFAILRAAFICDFTRVVTFMWGPGASATGFPQFGIGNHHGTSHSNNRAPLSSADKWYSEKTMPFIKSLIDTPDPAGGQLIDNTLVWYINENAEGVNHAITDMPFVLFGGDGVGLKNRGRVVDVSGKTSTDIWHSIAPVYGMPAATYQAPSTGPIAGLFS